MWLAVSTTGVGLNPIYLFTGSLAAIVAVALSVRSIVKSMIERSKEEALEKQEHSTALAENTKAVERLETSTDKLAEKLDKFTFDTAMKMADQDRKMEDLARRLDKVEKQDGK